MTRRRVPVVMLGRVAAEVLTKACDGRVLAVFPRSLYVRFEDGELVCVGGRDFGGSPLDVACALPDVSDWDAMGIAPETAAAIGPADATLEIGRVRLAFADAPVWPSPRPPALVDRASLGAGLDRLAVAVERKFRDDGLADLIPALSRSLACTRRYRGDRLLLGKALPEIGALTRWLESEVAGGGEPVPDVTGLIGLGPGLTPSGDDFLSGALVALRFLGYDDAADRLARAVLPAAHGRTGCIARAYLCCAARGMASQPLFDVLDHLVGHPNPGLEGALVRVDEVGHSSGWDGLSGAVAVCAAVAGRSHASGRRKSVFHSMGI